MIPRYNDDLTGEANLNVIKKRLINKLINTYSEYPNVYLNNESFMNNKKLENILNNIYENFDEITLLTNNMINDIINNGSISEFTNIYDYNDYLISLNTMINDKISKLMRYLDIIYNNINNLKMNDFNKIDEYMKIFYENYLILKSVSIKDINASVLYDKFKFLENNVSYNLKKTGGAGVKGKSGRKKKVQQQPILQKSDEQKEDEDEYDYSIDRNLLYNKWLIIIDKLEGLQGVFPRWNALHKIYNEKRPSLSENKLSGGNIYDASKTHIYNRYN